MFATPTKPDATAPIGVDGLRAILAALPSSSSSVPRIPTVCIGGINRDNAGDVISRSSAAIGEGIKDADSARTMRRTLDGVAVVSAIVAAADEHAAAADLLGEVVKARASLLNDAPDAVKQAAASLLNLVPPVLTAVARSTPLSHNMTNTVVQNFAANVALAIGGSPIMSTNADEASDLARLGGGLVVNIGTLMPGDVDAYVTAIAAYNSMSADAADGRSPVVFDPVGAGASELRKSAVRRILAHPNRIAILKGNEGEIAAVDALTTPPDEKSDRKGEEQKQQRGVDSTSTLAPRRLASLVRRLARRLRCVVVLTGATDYVAGVPPRPPPELQTAGKDDADVAVFAVRNGHPILGRITGSGCALGTVMSCTAAVAAGTVQHAGVSEGHMMVAAMAALLFFDVAGEEAVVTTDVHGRPVERGPGSFVPAFLDALADLSGKAKLGDTEKLMGRANVVRVTEFDD